MSDHERIYTRKSSFVRVWSADRVYDDATAYVWADEHLRLMEIASTRITTLMTEKAQAREDAIALAAEVARLRKHNADLVAEVNALTEHILE